MAVIIKTDGTFKIVKPEKKELTLKQLQEAVEGYIELVPILDSKYAGNIMFCNEDGIRLKKEFNPYASKIAGQNVVGNVIICGKGETS